MMRKVEVLLASMLLLSCTVNSQTKINDKSLAFPGAGGAGKYTVGGRGGQVYVVTNLNDDGEGSLRKGVHRSGSRTIVFAVAGTIHLERSLDINKDSITIAGQTAPGDGICLQGYGIKIKANEVILRYLRIRPGDIYAEEQDALSAIGNKNIIIDHCSMSWSTDEACSLYNNENLTLQFCIISESFNLSYHHKGEHGYGGIWGGNKASFHHNLLAHHKSRNPRFQGDRSLKEGQQELVEMVNNVIYNWGEKAAYAGEGGSYNMIANYFKPGPATAKDERVLFIEPYLPCGHFYLQGNVMDGSMTVTENNVLGMNNKKGQRAHAVASEPFTVSDLVIEEAPVAYQKVLKSAGASRVRDTVDSRIVREVADGLSSCGNNGIINSQEDAGEWPVLSADTIASDSDGDGMPDEWEIVNGLNPKNDDDQSLYSLSREYTNIEMYINGLVMM
jgi:pectate lyase